MTDTPTASPQQQMAREIASAGTPDFKRADVATATETASPGGNPTPSAQAPVAAPSAGQPADASTVPTATATPASASPQPAEGDKGAKDGAAPEAKTTDEEALVREALGIGAATPDTPEALKTKYEASSREAHRLQSEALAQAAALAEAGVEFVRTAEGKFALKPNQKYLDSIQDKDIPKVFDKLSESDKELVTPEVAEKIAKLALAEMLPKRPIAKATESGTVLSEEDTEKAFTELASEKLSNGQPRCADVNDSVVQGYMRAIYDKPEFDGLRSWMNRDVKSFKAGLDLLHAAVFRARAPLLAAKKDSDAARKAQEEKLKKTPTTAVSGAGVSPDAMRNKGTPGQANDPAAIARSIAMA